MHRSQTVFRNHFRGRLDLMVRRIPRLALADQTQTQMSQRSQIARSADGSLQRNRRHNACVEEVCELPTNHRSTQSALQRLVAHTAVALSEDVATKSEHAQRTLITEVLTHSRGVGADKVHLQLLYRFGRNDHILEVSKSGVNSVLYNLVFHNIINNLSSVLFLNLFSKLYIDLSPSLFAKIQLVFSISQLHQLHITHHSENYHLGGQRLSIQVVNRSFSAHSFQSVNIL